MEFDGLIPSRRKAPPKPDVDESGDDLFSGGFLGLDNLSAFDRSHLPIEGALEQSDATAWMYSYCLSLLRMATILSEHDPAYPPEMAGRLVQALASANVDYCCELYKGAAHGWNMADTPRYNLAASERHWRALTAFFSASIA